jgi:SAM-dependent methyltransferase
VRQGEFHDPRLVEVYDAECTWGRDDDAFLAFVEERPGSRVVDLGCGTGRLTVALAAAGHTLTGVDPAAASLVAARRKSDQVTWIEGTSADLPTAAFDTAVMTSHVAQFFLTDEAWSDVLTDLARAVVPAGRLAFDSRPPDPAIWARWNPVDRARAATLADGRVVRIATEVTDVDGDVVAFTHTYRFPDGEVLTSEAALRFRSAEDLIVTLGAAGWVVERIEPWPDDQLVRARRV